MLLAVIFLGIYFGLYHPLNKTYTKGIFSSVNKEYCIGVEENGQDSYCLYYVEFSASYHNTTVYRSGYACTSTWKNGSLLKHIYKDSEIEADFYPYLYYSVPWKSKIKIPDLICLKSGNPNSLLSTLYFFEKDNHEIWDNTNFYLISDEPYPTFNPPYFISFIFFCFSSFALAVALIITWLILLTVQWLEGKKSENILNTILKGKLEAKPPASILPPNAKSKKIFPKC